MIYLAALVLGSGTTATAGTTEKAVFVLAALTASASWRVVLASGGALPGRASTGSRGRLITAVA
ncbi:hypothetical protein CIB93_11680 [Streptomyces sp. WZ.A104]|uniref:hypothetical protein n=1 Tax=Streptomyces sp. WZ.A104 TaxID=2023771 RepID=UPI000BBBCCFF|nr:hypothetical protein [Streptomyces sp. WZ.A104]PCG85956.1 hypothetical protein CIB93_11680 [Streptomyces sp. WZ.A104]